MIGSAAHRGGRTGRAHQAIARVGTPGGGSVTTPAERADTYLRLMAESELRRALAYPRYDSPGTPGLHPGVHSAVRLSRPLLAPLLPPVRSAARRSGLLLATPGATSPWLRSPWSRSPWSR